MQSHPNAHGLRNKSFPHFEELTNVFGRDRATGMGAEAPADAVEEIEMDEQRYLHTPPALNESQEEESNFVSQSFTMPTPQTATNMPAAGPSRPSRSRKARNEAVEAVRELTSEMRVIGNAFTAAGDRIDKLTSCFRHESDTADRRMAIVSEVRKVQGISQSDVLWVGRKIAMDPLETDYFFSLPEEYREEYIQTLCSNLRRGGGV